MTAAELFYRAKHAILSQQERLSAPFNPWVSVADVQKRTATLKDEALAVPPLWTQGVGAEFLKTYPTAAESLRRGADEVIAGRLMLFGHEVVNWPRRPEWHRDPISSDFWPKARFYASIDFRAGGAKCVWEPARHQHLATLAQAFAIHGDPIYRDYLYGQLRHWLGNDVVARGVHWTSGIEIALRLVSWSWIIACASPDADDERLRSAWSAAIVNSATYLSRHLSRFSSANNHLVAEAVGLITASVLVPFWSTAAEWRTIGWQILEEEVERQIHADGVPAEQATHYLGFVTDLLLMAQAVDPGWPSNHAINERLQKAGDFVMACANGALELPVIGDHDSGYVFLPAGVPLDVRGRLGVLASIFGRGDFKAAAGALTPAAWLFLTAAQRARFEDTPPNRGRITSRDFSAGGYWVLRSGAGDRPIVVFDCGPLGYPSIAGHGHADCLSFALSLNDRWILVDPGAYVYHEEPVWRDYFRSTRAHNTLSVEDADQSRQTGPMMWGARARPHHISFKTSELCDWVEGEHDGYNSRSRLIHRRGIALCRSVYLLIVDRVSCERAMPVLVNFQFAPDALINQQGTTIHGTLGDAEVTMRPLFQCSVDVSNGKIDPPSGWVSRQFRLKCPAPAVQIRTTASCDTPLITMMWFGHGPMPVVEQRRHGECLVLRVASAEWTDEVFITPDATDRRSMLASFQSGPAVEAAGSVRACAV